MTKWFWIIWALFCLALISLFVRQLTGDDKSVFLIGETTYGHYQIEMACETCHTDPFGGQEVLQNACTQCHAEELEEAHDSHPKSKFTDPREAFRLEKIDARYCVSCHTEHQAEQTHEMGVTLPDDYCYHCHIETVEERESHHDLPFDSCADAGCHNYHDNRALYESFLVNNAHMPWISEALALPERNYAHYKAPKQIENQNKTATVQYTKKMPDDWLESQHALAGLECTACHVASNKPGTTEEIWIEKPGVEQCEECHADETKGFTSGKHGMRLAIDHQTKHAPTTITPKESPLLFHNDMLDAQHGCNACHSGHRYDTTFASVDACLTCHKDEHSLAYEASPHGQHRIMSLNQGLPLTNTVSCSTCHMPRIEAGEHSIKVGTAHAKTNHVTQNTNDFSESEYSTKLYSVQHNQNWNLRPNEKMIRPVCMSCHSLEFSIDALADSELIQSNFSGKPNKHIESIDWALERENR